METENLEAIQPNLIENDHLSQPVVAWVPAGAAARQLDIEIKTLRGWCEEGLIP